MGEKKKKKLWKWIRKCPSDWRNRRNGSTREFSSEVSRERHVRVIKRSSKMSESRQRMWRIECDVSRKRQTFVENPQRDTSLLSYISKALSVLWIMLRLDYRFFCSEMNFILCTETSMSWQFTYFWQIVYGKRKGMALYRHGKNNQHWYWHLLVLKKICKKTCLNLDSLHEYKTMWMDDWF